MRCFKCSAENSEARKFCRQCGSSMVICCSSCGFCNSLEDKYCGGCGAHLAGLKTPEGKEDLSLQTADVQAGKYSAEDLCELTDKSCQEKKKKEIKNTDELSQDLIDTLFDLDDSGTDKEEK